MPRWSLPVLTVCAAVALVHVGLERPAPATDSPPHHVQGGFRNLDPRYSYPLLLRARHVFRAAPRRGPMPLVLANDGAELRANGHEPTVTWVGHATLLIQIDGVNVLTDPHFGERASPVSFAGPRRLVPLGIAFADLPPIDAVVISHDHYDHLDLDTVRRLAREHRPTFFVPLGLKSWLTGNGVDQVAELDWWESRAFRGLTITCTPAQHSSGRGLHDQDLRLWSSWMLAGRARRVFFAGDTGYTASLAEIARRLDPPDLAVLPIGGYSDYPAHHPNHLNPEEAVRLFEDLRARLLVPMHWGTFDLNREPFREPPERLMAAARRRGVEEQVAVLSPGQTIPW
jgi:N-acyl-phosphatidylethanolamine-hydrolysing phospholipase D